MLALHDEGKIYSYPKEGKWAELPNDDKVSPAVAGWTDGQYTISELMEVPKPVIDDRKESVASVNQVIDGAPTQVWEKTPFSAEEIEVNRVSDISSACRSRIYAAAGDEEDQRNNLADFNSLLRKESKGTISNDELIRLNYLDDLITWVNGMRAASKTAIIDRIEVDDCVWPSPPV